MRGRRVLARPDLRFLRSRVLRVLLRPVQRPLKNLARRPFITCVLLPMLSKSRGTPVLSAHEEVGTDAA